MRCFLEIDCQLLNRGFPGEGAGVYPDSKLKVSKMASKQCGTGRSHLENPNLKPYLSLNLHLSPLWLMSQGHRLPRHPAVGYSPQLSWARKVTLRRHPINSSRFGSALQSPACPCISPAAMASHTSMLFPLHGLPTLCVTCLEHSSLIYQCPFQISPPL